MAFVAGLLSFLSPCTLPLFPSYLGYLSGVTLRPGAGALPRRVRIQAFLHALCFCVGLSVLFLLLGWGASALGQWLLAYRQVVRVLGGVWVVAMGLLMAGVWRSEWLLRERRLPLPVHKPLGYLGSVLVGVAFAAGWTPCIGPLVGSVLALIVTRAGGWVYMLAYALGFTVPFLLCAVALPSIRPLLRYASLAARTGGWLLVVMGVLLITNQLSVLAQWVQGWTGFSGF
ncbi:MAG: cytochrome c biogenesis protein CcdA [Alicyclobacillus sp.]|nr:cytochrome c biogenesis protein CcdA [Alicyclobacillus sp.]